MVEKIKQKSIDRIDCIGESVAGVFEIFPLLLILLIPLFIWFAIKESNPVYQQEILKAVERLDNLERLIKK